MAYVCFIVDAFSRRIVGWRVATHMRTDMVLDALEMARRSRGRHRLIGLVTHADAGSQFTSWAFTQRALDSGLVPSMGSIGDCYDNSVIESFWARMQVELLNRQRWRTRIELANAIFEYLEVFHNRQRRHSSLGMLSPIEYELRHATTARDQAS